MRLGVHSQEGFDRLFEWGPTGMRQLAEVVDVLVVVDVLSFATSVDIAVGRGAMVYPARWKDDRASDLAREHDAVLAVGRSATTPEHPYSLSPTSLTVIPQGTRLVLPSPNGAAICADAVALGVVVFAGCVRNAAGVAHAASAHGRIVGVIAAGEQWPDGSLRPALEDLVGAGIILEALDGHPSPEAASAIGASRAATSADLRECASARELIDLGFASDVELAVMPNVSNIDHILRDGAFVDTGTRLSLEEVPPMTATCVIEVVRELERGGVVVWLDGGWGIDALLGRETRTHADLDLVIDRDQLPSAGRLLGGLGFEDVPDAQPGLPAQVVVGERRRGQVDFHVVVFDSDGNGWQQLGANSWGAYPAGGLTGTGSVAGEAVRCLTAELQVRHHLGYEWDSHDQQDMRLLAYQFGVALPPTAI